MSARRPGSTQTIKQAIAKIARRRECETWTGDWNIQDLDKQHVLAQWSSIDRQVEPDRAGFTQHPAEHVTADPDAIAALNSNGIDARHGFGQGPKTDGFDEDSLTPRPACQAQIEALRAGLGKGPNDIFRRAGEAKRSGSVIGRPERQDCQRNAPVPAFL